MLALVNRMADNRSDLAILDASNVEAGPVAIVKLPHRVRQCLNRHAGTEPSERQFPLIVPIFFR